MRKKLLLIAIFCALILTLVVGVTYKYLMSQVYGEEQTNFETQVEKTIKTAFFDRDITQIEESKSGDNQYNKYYLYYSATENKNIIKQLEAQTQVASKQLKDSRSMVLSYVNEEKVNDALINRQLVTKEYIWDDKTKSLKYLGEIKELSEILLSKNRNEPRLKDIVNDESDLLAINRVVQEQLLSTRTKLKLEWQQFF